MMHRFALTQSRMPVLWARRGHLVGVDAPMAMPVIVTMQSRRGVTQAVSAPAMAAVAGSRRRRRSAPVVGGPVTPGDGRGDRAVVSVAVSGCDRMRRGRMVTVVNPSLGWRDRQNQGHQGRDRREGYPDDRFHDSILCPGRGVVTTHARNCFNTMGMSPGKSSLIKPGPNASAQAAWIQAPAQAASKLSMP